MTPIRVTFALMLVMVAVLLAAGCVGQQPMPMEGAPTYPTETQIGTLVTPDISPVVTTDAPPTTAVSIINSTFVMTPSPTPTRYMAGEVIVRYNPNLSKEQFFQISTALNTKIGVNPTDASAHNMPYIQLVHLPSDVSVESAVAFYKQNESVKWAQPNFIYNLA